jgi:two-component system chemotaxis response regulator CheB
VLLLLLGFLLLDPGVPEHREGARHGADLVITVSRCGKPLKATPEQFAKTVGKLGKIVLAAANSNLRSKSAERKADASDAKFDWNGHIVAMSASMGGIDALGSLLSHYPANCPPTVITLQTEPALANAFIARLDADLPCTVRAAKDGAALSQGHVYIAADPETHVVLEPGQPPKLRLLARDPVDGARPSANLLFGTVARAGLPSVGVVLTGMGEDGAKGLGLMKEAGCSTFAEDRKTATVSEAPAAAVAAGAVGQELPLDDLGAALLKSCSMH